ncbi:Sensor protein KdpD [bacterium HR17]|uniref:Sensor protein KdpD n=1 Tax=Candidatus Fervidibacter japonicus TaxID=2035412 RepID=A0A2H5XFJ7_9BACT|nr:Sensor protein KdpD [bacterium HR17]
MRTAKRLAEEMDAEWYALYVQTPRDIHISPAQRERLAHLLRLAERLGGRVLTVPGTSVAKTILEVARSHNITQIIVGKPLRPRWQEWLRGSIPDQLARAGEPFDILIVGSEVTPDSVAKSPNPAISSTTSPLAALFAERRLGCSGYLVKPPHPWLA